MGVQAGRPWDDESEAASYVSYVEREMGGLMKVAKVLQAAPDQLVDTFLLLMPSGSQAHVHFVRVVELKVGGGGTKLCTNRLLNFPKKCDKVKLK